MDLNSFLKQTNIIDKSDSGTRSTHFILAILSPILFIIAGALITLLILFVIGVIAGIVTRGNNTQFSHWFSTSPFSMMVETGASIIAVFLWVKFFEKRKFNTIGFYKNNALKKYLIGFAVGIILLSLSALVIMSTCDINIISGDLSSKTILPFIIVILAWCIQGASEEIILRGFIMPKLSKRFNVLIGVVGSSVIFALLHLGNHGISMIAILNLTLFGIFASLYVLYTDNLWGISAFHSAWNFAQGNVFGFFVSGGDHSWTKALSTSYTTNNSINGGAFGPEGGFAVTLILVLSSIIFFVLLNKKKKKCLELNMTNAL